MPRIQPLRSEEYSPDIQLAFQKHVQEYQARITNMKASLGHSLLAFEVYMQWYPLYQEVEKIVGKRGAYLFAYAISTGSDCPLCSTFFRRILIEAGEQPDSLHLQTSEQELLDFGSAIAQNKGIVSDELFERTAGRYSTREMVILIAFAGQMIATNVFNNVIETEIDEYLIPYLKPMP
ncbi:MAG: hypothetical protein K1X82_02000 [Bacteroidia bacterium]|nr:hypothetical protein [Bacteroidia bacterium]